MTRLLQRVNPRELMLAVAVVLLAIGLFAYRTWMLPAYDAWSGVRAQAEAKRLERDKLTGFLQVRNVVEQRYTGLDAAVFQTDSDPVTLSRFLRQIEGLARLPSMTIVNAKPQPVEDLGTHKRFPIRLSVSGTLPEVSQFVVGLLNGPDVTGMGSFSLRGVQGGRFVECSLSVWMVRLKPVAEPERGAGTVAVATSGGEVARGR